MLTLVGKWIATITYLAASLSKIDFVNIPQSGLALSHATSLSRFHPHKCQKFHHVIQVDILGPLQCLRPTRAAKRLCPWVHQQVHDFRLALLSRQIHGRVAWRLLTPELTPFNIFNTYLNYLDLINMCIADFDKWRFNVWQPVSHFRIGSRLSKKSPICKCQRQGWTPKLPASTKTCYVDGDRDTSKILALELQGNLEEGNAT